MQEHLKGKDVSISEAFLNSGPFNKDRVSIVGTVVVQIAMVHLLELVEVKAKHCFGYSFGELASAYHNKLLTLEETIDYAFFLNEAVFNNDGLSNISAIRV